MIASNALAETETLTLDTLDIWDTEVSVSSLRVEGDDLLIRQADHISDLLRTLPGVDVGGAHSLNQRITVRSMDDKDLTVTIDGARQNAYMFHHMGNLQIHADILESAEIQVGANSVLDGGLGGAARFKTKSADALLQPGQTLGGRVRATYGDNSVSSVALTGYGKVSRDVDFLAYINQVANDNYEVGGGQILDFNGNEVAGTDGTVRGLEGDVSDALVKLGWDIDTVQRLTFGFEHYNDEGDYSQRPDMGLATDLAIANGLGIPLTWPTEFTRDTVSIQYTGELGSATSVEATVYNNDSTLFRDESGWSEAGNPAFQARAGTVDGDAKNTGLNLLAETQLGTHLLTWGIEANTYDTEYVSQLDSGTTRLSDEKQTSTALYLQDRIALSDRLSVTPGIRYDNEDLESAVVTDTFDNVRGALALEFAASAHWQLRASATQLFKAPEIGEVFIGAGLNDQPNPDIEAETGLNSEVSASWQAEPESGDGFSAGFTVFQTDIDNYIYDYANGPSGQWKDNVGDMRVSGGEAWIGWQANGLEALLTFSSADSELDAFADYAALDTARLDRKQGDTISLNIDYQLASRPLKLHWDVLLVDDLAAGVDLDGASEDTAKDGYTVHNVSAQWRPTSVPGLELTFGIDNLFDEFFASQSSRTGLTLHPVFGELYLQDYEPGRNIKLTAAYTFPGS
ncbi:MAG: TonB-dependent receptor [Pseudomonadota bacterium]